MAIYPKAVWRPLPENATQAKIKPRIAILHTAVDGPNTKTLYEFFRYSSGAESHFYVTKDGVVEQYMDTNVKANANKSADDYAISIETWDGGRHDLRWNAAQQKSIIELLDWACTTHNIPRRQCESPTGSGIGWHSMWNDKNGRTPWSLYAGKTCPGTGRVPQIKDTIIPALQGKVEPPKDWFDMATKDELAEVVRAVVRDEVAKAVKEQTDDNFLYIAAEFKKIMGQLAPVTQDEPVLRQIVEKTYNQTKKV